MVMDRNISYSEVNETTLASNVNKPEAKIGQVVSKCPHIQFLCVSF